MSDQGRPTRKHPMAAAEQAIPVRIGPTSVRHYISGHQALNLIDPDCPSSGDSQSDGAWFVPHQGRTRDGMDALIANRTQDGYLFRTPHELLGWDRLFDARPSLRFIGHPEGEADVPVWAAHHDRAIIDGGWSWLTEQPSGFPGSYDGPSVAEWLWTDVQFGHVHRLARKLETSLDGEARRLWRRWMRDLTPDAEWERGTHMRRGISA